MAKAHTKWLLLIALTLIWGSSYILMKRGLVAFQPVQLATIRLSISMLALSPLLLGALRKFPRRKIGALLLVGLFGSCIPAFLYALSLTRIDSAIAGIINSMVPLFTLIIGALFFAVPSTWARAVGVFLGLVGTSLLVLLNASGGFRSEYVFALLPVIASVCYGTSTNIIKNYLDGINPRHLAAMIYLVAGIPCLIALPFTGAPEVLMNHPKGWESLAYIALLALLGSSFAMILFTGLVMHTNALFASTVTYLIPIVALGRGIADGERLGLFHLVGLCLILVGVYIVNKRG